jgi:hypothetical protein
MLGVLHSLGYTRGLTNTLGFSERGRIRSLVWHARVGLMDKDQRSVVLGGGGVGALTLWERAPLVFDLAKVPFKT